MLWGTFRNFYKYLLSWKLDSTPYLIKISYFYENDAFTQFTILQYLFYYIQLIQSLQRFILLINKSTNSKNVACKKQTKYFVITHRVLNIEETNNQIKSIISTAVCKWHLFNRSIQDKKQIWPRLNSKSKGNGRPSNAISQTTLITQPAHHMSLQRYQK